MDQQEKRIANYKALLQLYPDHYWANNNLFLDYRRERLIAEALPYSSATGSIAAQLFWSELQSWAVASNFDE